MKKKEQVARNIQDDEEYLQSNGTIGRKMWSISKSDPVVTGDDNVKTRARDMRA